jgi:hypothetical protein
MIEGTYEGEDETAALDKVAQERGHADFKASCKVRGLSRDKYTVEEVKE